MEKYLFVLTMLVLISARPAHAYIDPGTGSMIIQAIIGGILAGALTFRMWYGKLKDLIEKKKKDKKSADEK